METGAHLRLIFGKAHKAVERVDRASIAHCGLNFSDFSIMEVLLHKGPLPINTIGEKILLTSGSMTAAAKRLEKRQLAERIKDPVDGRCFYLHLTPKGLTLIRAVYDDHRQNLERLFGCLTENERDDFSRLLKKVGYHADQLEV